MKRRMSLPAFSVQDMRSLSVEGSGLKRTAIVPPEAQGDGFTEAYDWTTLWYDAVAREDRLLLVCPKLLNFKAMMADGALKLDGAPVRLRRIRQFRRHDIVELDRPDGASEISTSSGRWSGASGISPDRSDLFAGLNASLHISRNNRLEWIADWARFHVAEHGLEGMLVMDNGSDAYPPEAIAETLAGTRLKRAVVLKVPQPYGPVRSKTGGGGAKFLQPAMLNLARLRFLHRARAVLNADIDELVWTRGGSVFDAAVKAPMGIVSFEGRWFCPPQGSAPPFHHRDHVHPQSETAACPTKYCLRPDGWRAHIGWDVHKPEVPLVGAFTRRSDLGYWHCRNITTDWKAYKRIKDRKVGPADPFAVVTLERALPVR